MCHDGTVAVNGVTTMRLRALSGILVVAASVAALAAPSDTPARRVSTPPALSADLVTYTHPAPAGPSPTLTALTRAAAAPAAAPAPSVPGGASYQRTLSRHVNTSCAGNGKDGSRIFALYARERSTPSRYAALTPTLRHLTANIDDLLAVSAARYGVGLRVRWVLDGTCAPLIREVVLPDGALTSGDFGRFQIAMMDAGYWASNRKFLVYADAKRVCGLAGVFRDDRPDPAVNANNRGTMFARIDVPCWLPGASVDGFAPAHEVMHILGAVTARAPHATEFGHCTDGADVMCYPDARTTKVRTTCASAEPVLDCGGDDYFNPRPKKGSWLASHWNIANSSFLDRVPALPAVPAASTSGPSTATRGHLVRLRARTNAAVAAYQWSGPGITAGRSSATLTARPVKGKVATYTLRVSYRNGRAATVTRTIRLR